MKRDIVESMAGEFVRYKALAEAAIRQLADAELTARANDRANSVAIICSHLSGNLRSRFTDFLTSDGEKPWRHREEEFAERAVTRAVLLAKWEEGWQALYGALEELDDDDLARTVSIRGQPLQVHEALHRSLAHVSYHVGQIVYIAKTLREAGWTYLSIPPGASDQYNRQPVGERPARHAAKLAGSSGDP